MKDFNCRKCGSIDVFIKTNGTQVGLYCSDCGAWQKWLSKDEQRLAEQWIEYVKSEKKQMVTESELGLPIIHNTGLSMREEITKADDLPPWEITPNTIVKSEDSCLEDIRHYGKAINDAIEYAEITIEQASKFMSKFSEVLGENKQ